MLWLWISGGIAALIALLCLLRLRVQADIGETLSILLFIGPVRIQLVPSKKEKKPETAQEMPKKEKNAPALTEKLKSVPKPSAADIKDAYHTLKPVFLRALRRTRRGICICPLDVAVILGGREDPAQTAENYGYANAAVWTAMPVLEQLLDIRKPAIHIGMDFEAVGTTVRGKVGVGMRIGTLLVLAFGIAVPVIRWFMKYLKRKKAETASVQQAAAATAA